MFRAAALFLVAAGAAAQTLVESPDATPGGRLGLEAAVQVALDAAVDVSGPEALVLVGLGRGVEARIGFPDVVGLDLRGEPARGLGDAALGVKVETGRVAGWRTGVLAEVSLPTGSDGVGSGTAAPVVLLLAVCEVGRVEVGLMAEGTWNPVPGRADGGGGVLVSTAWGPLGAFAEALARRSGRSAPPGARAGSPPDAPGRRAARHRAHRGRPGRRRRRRPPRDALTTRRAARCRRLRRAPGRGRCPRGVR